MRLGASWARANRRLERLASGVPIYCRSGSAAWLERLYPHLSKAGLEVRAFGNGELLEPLPAMIDGVTVTPITTTHSTADLNATNPLEVAQCCCGYLLELPGCRVALLWDLDATNTWLESPAAHQLGAVERLRGVDHVFFDCNTWHNSSDAHGNPASHISFTLLKKRGPQPRAALHLAGASQRSRGRAWQWLRVAQRRLASKRATRLDSGKTCPERCACRRLASASPWSAQSSSQRHSRFAKLSALDAHHWSIDRRSGNLKAH